MKMSQEQFKTFTETGEMPADCTRSDVIEAGQEYIEKTFGINGETPNREAYQRYMSTLGLIGFMFCDRKNEDVLN